MAARIRLSKGLILKAFCYSCQGYRSVQRAVQQGFWPAFQAYYASGRSEGIDVLIGQLLEATPEAYRDLTPPRVEELYHITPNVGLLRTLFGRWLAKRKQNWQFRVEEIRFIACTFQRMLNMLERPIAPTSAELFSLQFDLCNCSGIFDIRCYGLPELKRARHIEHFDQTEWIQHWQLWEILGEQAPVTPSGSSPVKAAG